LKVVYVRDAIMQDTIRNFAEISYFYHIISN